MNFWKQMTHVMSYFKEENFRGDKRLPSSFMEGFLEVSTSRSSPHPLLDVYATLTWTTTGPELGCEWVVSTLYTCYHRKLSAARKEKQCIECPLSTPMFCICRNSRPPLLPSLPFQVSLFSVSSKPWNQRRRLPHQASEAELDTAPP